ncbi:uncharacterized protein LOC125250810 isoform X2 [Megalobrama amblycephala]|uniref:uncharacterized protein LOC125250810 isoform X2 n=1 Tax=Megalobrama amblycephala TaxID=75352 RepID=UPI002013FE5A|nr:uncharacterized protein LOC125250810 isoform X2 [Megalobrama amblycephala]
MYYIVEFLEESLVGIVAECWTFEDDGQQLSYWPPNNQTKRAKKEEIPDEETWITRKIRVFAKTDDFEKALRWSKNAELNSSVESDTGNNFKRPTRKPSRFEDSSDDEWGNATWMPNLKRKRQDEPFPRLKATAVRKRPDKEPSHHPTCDPSVPTSQDLPEDVEEPPRRSSVAATEHANVERQPWTRPPRDVSMPNNLKETLQSLLQKVDSLAASQREILLLLRRNQGRQREDDILDLKTAQCKEELEELENHLKDPEFRKKVTHHLSLIGGANPGECVRRVMRAVATNNVWCHYSLHGKRKKLALIKTTTCKVITHAVMKYKAGLGEKEIESLMAETLKHAPAHINKSAEGHVVEEETTEE